MDKHFPSRHSGENRNPLDPGLCRDDERGNQEAMIFSQNLRR